MKVKMALIAYNPDFFYLRYIITTSSATVRGILQAYQGCPCFMNIIGINGFYYLFCPYSSPVASKGPGLTARIEGDTTALIIINM